MLLQNKAPALCASRSSLGCHRILHATVARPRIACGAGKRAGGGGGSPSSGQPHSQRSQKTKRSYDGREEDAPQSQASPLARTITREISNTTRLPELEDVVSEWGGTFNFIHRAAAFSKAGKLAQRRPAAARPLLDGLAAIWDTLLPTAGARELANVLWACGKLGYTNNQLWSSTLEAFVEQQDSADCQGVANVVYALSQVAAANRGQVPGVSRTEVVEAVGQLAGQLQVFVTHPDLPGVAPQHISNTLLACAKLRINPGDAQLNSLLQAMARPAMREETKPQELANTLYAVSELQQHCSWQPAVKQQVWQQLLGEDQLRKVADQGVPQDVANSCLALAHLASAAAISRPFAQDCVVQLLRGSVAQQQLDRWTAQGLSNTMWACAKLGLDEHDFLQRAAAAAPGWLPSAVAPDLAQVAWSCATLHFKHQQLMAGVVQRSKQLLQQGAREHIRQGEGTRLAATVGWAAAVLDMPQLAGDVQALIASSSRQKSKLRAENAGMLWAAHTWLLLLRHQLDGQGLAGLLTAEQLAVCEAAAAGGTNQG